MSTYYSPTLPASDQLKKHMADQHPGADSDNSVATVASATDINVSGLRVAFITGTTTIAELSGGVKGQIVTLSFSTSLTVTSSATLACSGGTDFSATDLDTATFLCVDDTAGTNVWTQVNSTGNNAA